MPRLTSVEALEALRTELTHAIPVARPSISICASTSCGIASGAQEVLHALSNELRRRGLEAAVELKSTGCHGLCEREPTIIVGPDNVFYTKVAPRDAADIIGSIADGSKPVERLLYQDALTGDRALHQDEIPFYKTQRRILFGNNGKVDPNRIDDYLRVGGYAAVAKVLGGMTPETVVETITKSGLRGRGGAGFPTGLKWSLCRKNGKPNGHGEIERYIICNADEGDPGAFMDRSLLEGNPHTVIEGMIIGGFALGAKQGFVYVRAEYPLAVKHLGIAIKQAEELGLLGDNILGTGLSFRIRLVQGAGAFVCGEETALIASIEGRVGEPHPRPPYPVEKGLFGKPTVINNVKTWASVGHIVNRGADWYSAIGTEKSKGTMVFSLVGKINNTGLVEVPMGISLHEMIYDIGGGIPNGRSLKAVQIGGPSGGCIPADLIDLKIDYEQLTQAGSMMGSGGMVVMDDSTCMVDVARYFMEFLEEESCGQCFPCRQGTQEMKAILTRICEGRGKEDDLDTLQDLAWVMKETSLCGLGQTAANPVLTTLRYFRNEYLAHIRDEVCPAKVCKKLILYEISPTLCDGCGACVKVCSGQGILGQKGKAHKIDQAKCTKCGACMEVCKPKAVLVS